MAKLSAVERLKHVKTLLKIERDEDYRLYKELFLRVNLEQRKKNGVTWYPIKINNEELGSGELLHLEIERTSQIDKPHQFSSGKNVSLFSNQQNETHEITGTIKSVSKNSLKLIIHCDELPDWCYEGKLGLNIQFDDNSYNEMQRALDQVIDAKHNRVAELREMIEGELPLTFEKINDELLIPQLNLSQNRAIRHVMSVKDIGVVHGPPGTGKTTSLVQAIRLTLQTEKQVLVCAPTNSAVDLLTEKLVELGIDVLRLGHPARMAEELLASSMDGKISSSPYYKDIKNLRRNAEEYFKMAGKYKRKFGKEEAQQRAALYTEAKNCIKEARLLEDFIVDELFKTSQVICCTPVTSTHRALVRKRFDTLFFDEASQALEPMVWIPLLKCKRLILSGDHFQLPPVVKSIEAKRGGLDETLLDKCISLKDSVVLLNRQYRMNTAIMGFSNSYFYKNELIADETVATHVLVNDEESYLSKSIEFIDTAGCSFDEIQNPETLSYSNPKEGNILFKHLQQLLIDYSTQTDLASISIGIISPYKEQREWLKENITQLELEKGKLSSLSVKTIDGFQGEERDVIYISLVRSNDNHEIGFLNDLRRMNVAITRAKKKLVVIGDSATIASSDFYQSFLEYCEKNGMYRTAWEWAN
ncbi:AAA domain-containing protein [Aurantibacillus circumpalustris]|uniref:AAA domain-containing protein n=1 Tax=Aurantibacillus circumpalustris TaxID=3036359 RepID=UPI00295B53B9|nr:AAA domain-containing protein [Aurantibacillus circumpalustris]